MSIEKMSCIYTNNANCEPLIKFNEKVFAPISKDISFCKKLVAVIQKLFYFIIAPFVWLFLVPYTLLGKVTQPKMTDEKHIDQMAQDIQAKMGPYLEDLTSVQIMTKVEYKGKSRAMERQAFLVEGDKKKQFGTILGEYCKTLLALIQTDRKWDPKKLKFYTEVTIVGQKKEREKVSFAGFYPGPSLRPQREIPANLSLDKWGNLAGTSIVKDLNITRKFLPQKA